ncbi:cell envelope integrity EipB family protein [Xanthobacter autotrophicus]|uniref:cell envelope integrity EipB family protein n=1 Tax=Xanthobacter autotrophicus TaxID=280 RepID=UPI00372A2EE9
MQFRSCLAFVAVLAVFGLGAASAGAVPLLPHKATYRLSLDGSKPSGQLEEMNGLIQYEITGDACAGYSTLTRQESLASTGEGSPLRQAVTSKAWEDGAAQAYRFLSTSTGDDGDEKIEASVERQGRDALKVTVTQPAARTLDLKGDILLPTEHVKRVLAAAAAGESVLEAKVYDGANDPAKVYETLAVVGRPSTDENRIAAPAKDSLAGRTFYPVTISYFETGGVDRAPAYVMNMQLYDNGVVGSLKIDYGKFALVGAMSTFEALKAPGGCAN